MHATAILALLSAVGIACGTAEDPQDRVSTDPGTGRSGIAAVIEQKRQLLKDVPGRTGILAEQRRYSVFDEELIIRDFFRDRKNGFYLDVGCAWPERGSNTYYLEEHLGWTGIGVDALADYAPAWKQKRPRSRFFSYLVTDRSDTEETFFKSPRTGLSSTDRSLATGKRFGENLEPEEIRVSSITLNDLLDRQGVEKIDLLSMDIEGHELPALAGFDIERFAPELVVIEGGKGAVAGYFEARGYELVERYLPFDDVNRYFQPRRDGAAEATP